MYNKLRGAFMSPHVQQNTGRFHEPSCKPLDMFTGHYKAFISQATDVSRFMVVSTIVAVAPRV